MPDLIFIAFSIFSKYILASNILPYLLITYLLCLLLIAFLLSLEHKPHKGPNLFYFILLRGNRASLICAKCFKLYFATYYMLNKLVLNYEMNSKIM